MPIRRGFAHLFWKLSKWTYVPESPRFSGSRVVIGAPHTSNWDFVFMLCIAWSEGLRPRWLGKKSLFSGWRRPIMRALGGIPVDRANPAGLVDTLVADELLIPKDAAIALRPEQLTVEPCALVMRKGDAAFVDAVDKALHKILGGAQGKQLAQDSGLKVEHLTRDAWQSPNKQPAPPVL